MNINDLIWVEISREKIKHNINNIKDLLANKVILSPCVKANAYGHGLVGYAQELIKNGADWLSVNSIFEATILRQNNITVPILIIGYVGLAELEQVIELDCRIVVYNYETVQELSRLNHGHKRIVKVHIKVDTGMGRQGIFTVELEEFIVKTKKLSGLEVEGISTHFASSDDLNDTTYFQQQLKKFKEIETIANKHKIKLLHSANSAATLIYPEAHFNLVRPGISIYGLYPDPQVEKNCLANGLILEPCLSLKTKVAQIKTLPPGISISYGCTFTTEKQTRVAVLPIGYYDGLDRRLSNIGEVLIRGQRAPIRGRVCMNMVIVEISHIDGVKVEDEAVIIGQQGKEEITATEIADKIGTINYEITTRLRGSIPRYYV